MKEDPEIAAEEQSKKEIGKLNKEERIAGKIDFSVYRFYFSQIECFGMFIIVFLFAFFVAVKFFSDIWLAFWLENKLNFSNTNNYIYIYLGILVFSACLILRRKMSFFDTTPSG